MAPRVALSHLAGGGSGKMAIDLVMLFLHVFAPNFNVGLSKSGGYSFVW